MEQGLVGGVRFAQTQVGVLRGQVDRFGHRPDLGVDQPVPAVSDGRDDSGGPDHDGDHRGRLLEVVVVEEILPLQERRRRVAGNGRQGVGRGVVVVGAPRQALDVVGEDRQPAE